MPTMSLMNGVAESLNIPFDNTSSTTMFYTGTVMSNVARQFRATCPQSLQYFPFDTQSCTLLFQNIDFRSTAKYTSSQVFIVRADAKTANTDLYVQGGEFTYLSSVVNSTVVGLEKLESYSSAFTVTLTFKRNPLYYLITIVVPSLLLLCKFLFCFLNDKFLLSKT